MGKPEIELQDYIDENSDYIEREYEEETACDCYICRDARGEVEEEENDEDMKIDDIDDIIARGDRQAKETQSGKWSSGVKSTEQEIKGQDKRIVAKGKVKKELPVLYETKESGKFAGESKSSPKVSRARGLRFRVQEV